MALLMISKVNGIQDGLTTYYDFNTKMFNESVFKICSCCGVFAYDVSELFCDCGRRFEYVNVSDMDSLRFWLDNLALNEKRAKCEAKCVDYEEYASDFDSDYDSETGSDSDLLEGEHICYTNDDCTNEDCIDCADLEKDELEKEESESEESEESESEDCDSTS